MKFRHLRNEKGISLLEAMVAFIIFSFGLIGLAPMFSLSIESNVIARDNSFASNLIKETIEEYQGVGSLPALPFEETEDILWTKPTLSGEDTSSESTSSTNIFSRTISLEDNSTDASIPNGVVQIDVNISWLNLYNRQKNLSSTSYLIES
ncbi:MAG: type II secretion system protein [candidate division Zixibacteria bacterium]|nr:type II secretion system protein [candidate division Zixibacteria bacterium]